MSAERNKVKLWNYGSEQFDEAELIDGIESKHLEDFEQLWLSFPGFQQEGDGHWDWAKKMACYWDSLAYNAFALECDAKTQGLMIVNMMKRCRLPKQTNKHLEYVEYVATAPWNRKAITSDRIYRGVGSLLIATAIQLSIDEGNHGRIGLHALPEAETFYKDNCGMINLGLDESHDNLRYFEMTESQATAFMQEMNDEA